MWEMPEVSVGDRVLFYANPYDGSDSPSFGFVSSRPGKETIKILVFTENSGFVEKMSVRHKEDPFWQESETAQQWQVWGCWKLHPETAAIREIRELIARKPKSKESAAA